MLKKLHSKTPLLLPYFKRLALGGKSMYIPYASSTTLYPFFRFVNVNEAGKKIFILSFMRMMCTLYILLKYFMLVLDNQPNPLNKAIYS